MVLHHSMSRDELLARSWSFPNIYCYIRYSILNETLWKMYVPIRKQVLDSLTLTDTLSWERLDVDCNYILQ